MQQAGDFLTMYKKVLHYTKGFVFITIATVVFVIGICDIIFSRIKSVSYTVKSDKIIKPIKAVFISDFHNGRNGKRIIKLTEKISPDAVFLGGDMADRHTGTKKALELIKILSKKYKCYFAPGNHDEQLTDTELFYNQLKKMGVTVLDNDVATVSINKNRIQICGINYNDDREDTDEDKGNSLAVDQIRRLNDISHKSLFRVLLAHFPIYAKSYSKCGFDLILCGHEHGGIVRLPKIKNGLLGHKGFFPKFSGGLYSFAYSTMIVSRGIAYPLYNILIPRLFNNPEFVTILIENGKRNLL